MTAQLDAGIVATRAADLEPRMVVVAGGDVRVVDRVEDRCGAVHVTWATEPTSWSLLPADQILQVRR